VNMTYDTKPNGRRAVPQLSFGTMLRQAVSPSASPWPAGCRRGFPLTLGGAEDPFNGSPFPKSVQTGGTRRGQLAMVGTTAATEQGHRSRSGPQDFISAARRWRKECRAGRDGIARRRRCPPPSQGGPPIMRSERPSGERPVSRRNDLIDQNEIAQKWFSGVWREARELPWRRNCPALPQPLLAGAAVPSRGRHVGVQTAKTSAAPYANLGLIPAAAHANAPRGRPSPLFCPRSSRSLLKVGSAGSQTPLPLLETN